MPNSASGRDTSVRFGLTASALVPDRLLCSFHPARYGSDPPRW